MPTKHELELECAELRAALEEASTIIDEVLGIEEEQEAGDEGDE